MNNAPVAQLDRVPDYESEGRGFESRRAHHFIMLVTAMICGFFCGARHHRYIVIEAKQGENMDKIQNIQN